MEKAEITSKTLEFPYGSMMELVVSSHAFPGESDPSPPSNQPNPDSFCRTLFPAVFRHSPDDRVCPQKGSSHSGFSMIFFTLLGNRPFWPDLPGCVQNRVRKGPEQGQKGPERLRTGSKGAKYSPSQAQYG